MELRPYQQSAVDAVYASLRGRDDSPCVVIPTGGGKTPVMAAICRDAVTRWDGRVLILAHVKELLIQTANNLNVICPEVNVGVYSAGLKSRDTIHPVIVAGIQSAYQRANELGSVDLIMVDECHLIPPEGDGMYRRFLEQVKTTNPHVRLIGLTATPFRMKSGMICAPEHALNHVCYEISVKALIDDGYLCDLTTKGSQKDIDTSGLHVRAGEFIDSEAQALMNTEGRVALACREIIQNCRDRKACLIFATGIAHGQHIVAVLRDTYRANVAAVFGDTLPYERERVLMDFKAGGLKFLVNVNLLTTGFDAPNVDCVALVRPTASPGLYYQMVGRGFRLHPSKENTLVLDFGGNVVRHGPVNDIRIRKPGKKSDLILAKKCPKCMELVLPACMVCPDCGYEFPPSRGTRKLTHGTKASDAKILSGEVTFDDLLVVEVDYYVHHKRGAPDSAPKTMRVDYCTSKTLHTRESEWICIEHDGWARHKAYQWWTRRSSVPCPKTAAEAVALAARGALAEPTGIRVKRISDEPFPRIVGYTLGEKSEWNEAVSVSTVTEQYEPWVLDKEDSIPF